MSRPLPLDLIPIVDSRGPSVANPGLRLLRWVDWGDDFALPEADETTYLKHSVNLFKKQAKPDSVLSHALAARNARTAERVEALRAQGWHLQSLRAPCAGRLRLGLAEPAPADPGLCVDRNLGTPFAPARCVLALIRAGFAMLSDGPGKTDPTEGLVVFDAWPVTVPSLESDFLPAANNQPAREHEPARRFSSRPVELLSVQAGSELEFWIAARDPALVQPAIHALETALAAFSSTSRASIDDETPEVEIAAGPVVIPAADGTTAGMIARATTVSYQVHNGRIVAMFSPASGKEVKAEEQASNVAMTDEVRKRLAKKKVLQDIEIEVEAVGNGWKIRAVHG